MLNALAPYLWLMRLTFLKLMAYRMRYLTGIATYGVFVGGQYAIWQAVFAAKELQPHEKLGGLTFAELTTYIAIGYIARSAYFTNTDSEIAARFHSGDVTIDLLRPLSFHGQWLAQAGGETLFRILFFAAPMSLVLVPLFGVMPPQGDGWWQFPLFFCFAFLINAELNIMAGNASFWLEDVTGLMSLKRNAMMLLSGVLVPLHYFGDWLSAIFTLLPFALISYYPTMAYLGQLETNGHQTLSTALTLAVVWCLILRLINITLWRAAARRLEVQGG
jgi:ABC-2 type transport system permease protein